MHLSSEIISTFSKMRVIKCDWYTDMLAVRGLFFKALTRHRSLGLLKNSQLFEPSIARVMAQAVSRL
jgi:hypothetical protein